MRGRVPDLMDELGISERELIDKHLRRQLNAKKTIFAQKDGEFTDKRTVDALETQTRALDMAFLLHGSYAPRDQRQSTAKEHSAGSAITFVSDGADRIRLLRNPENEYAIALQRAPSQRIGR